MLATLARAEAHVRICPEFPCDNPKLACDSREVPSVVLLRVEAELEAISPAIEPWAHGADERPSGIFVRSGVPAEPEDDIADVLQSAPFAPAQAELGEVIELGADGVPEDGLEPVDDPFTADLLPAIAELSGARAALAIELLEAEIVPDDAGVRAALRAFGIAGDGGLTPAFRTAVTGWRAVLRGDLDDVSACGGRMLDEWAAEVVAAVRGEPERVGELRRGLRARGVCAFGLVRAA
jgi:hypothetical protein